jgi:polyhydroxyalkanoate synthesis regulator phasin
MGRKDKKQKTKDDHDFVKDGMETNEIRNVVQDIMLYIEEKRNKMEFKDIITSLKDNINRVEFFEKRYPMLYQMVTKEEGFEYQSLEYFLKMREGIIQNQMTTDEASKIVGQLWFDKYCKNKVDK